MEIDFSQDWCAQIVLQSPIAVYACDEEGRITHYNEAAAELWGRKPERNQTEWSGGWKLYDLDGQPLPLSRHPMFMCLQEKEIMNGTEMIVERTDNTRRTVRCFPHLLKDKNGKTIGGFNTMVDVTAEKIAEEKATRRNDELRKEIETKINNQTGELIKKNLELQSSEERHRKMISEVKDYAILLMDKDGFIQDWNQGAEKIKGYKASEIIGKNFRIFYLKEDRESKLPEKLIAEAVSTGRAIHEGWRLRKDGTKFWGSITITALHNDDNEIIGFSKVTRDLTERMQATENLRIRSEELAEKNKALDRSNRELESFTYVASHDMQEPLRKIRTFSNLILSKSGDELDSNTKNYLDKINRAADRMTTQINDLLHYSRITSIPQPLEKVDLNEVVEVVKEDFELLITEKKATILHTPLPVIESIPLQMTKLFGNLIGNSLKFSNPRRPPVISVSSRLMDEEEVVHYHLNRNCSYYDIQFTDNGIGFDQKFAKQIFTLFQRLNDRSKFPGSGIGLALCRKIAENAGGKIFAEGREGEGAVFHCLLPEKAIIQVQDAFI